MLPTNIIRSDEPNSIPASITSFHKMSLFTKIIILLFTFPMILLERSWLIGIYQNKVIYCGLSDTLYENQLISYNHICNNNREWACSLYHISSNIKICLIVYYIIFSLYSIYFTICIYKHKFYFKYSEYVSVCLNIFFYITLLTYANLIPHKFDNTLVQFYSAFGVSFICCVFHMFDNYLYFIRSHLDTYLSQFLEFFYSFKLCDKVFLTLLMSQIFFTLPSFIISVNWQNTTPLCGIFWIFSKTQTLYYTFEYMKFIRYFFEYVFYSYWIISYIYDETNYLRISK